MKILLSANSKQPIYEQLEDQIRCNILEGYLKHNEKLPSIRLLAKDLGVSVITVKRAYDDLERDGYIRTLAGKGSYVSGLSLERLREKEISLMESTLTALVDQAKKLALSEDDFHEIIHLIWEEGI